MCESEVTKSCLTLSDPMDRSLPGSSLHGIFQARVLEEGGGHCLPGQVEYRQAISPLHVSTCPDHPCQPQHKLLMSQGRGKTLLKGKIWQCVKYTMEVVKQFYLFCPAVKKTNKQKSEWRNLPSSSQLGSPKLTQAICVHGTRRRRKRNLGSITLRISKLP